jgi:hypothetical protein
VIAHRLVEIAALGQSGDYCGVRWRYLALP